MDGGQKYNLLVIDAGGLCVDFARTLGQQGHKVWYFCPWYAPYSKFEAYAPGVGVPEIQKVMGWASYVDEADCIIFPDCGMGELADWLRHKGYVVFGAGKGEEMEQDRGTSTQVMQKIGIKYPKTYSVKGIPQALETIKSIVSQKNETNQNATGKAFVKFNVWRGTVESFPVASMEEAEYMFDKVRGNLGPYANAIPMVIQETVDGVETGADLFFNGEEFVMPGMWGFEDGGNYLGYVTEDMGIFKNDLDRAAKYFRSCNYRGAFSFECMYDGKDCYWIDWTCRFPMPLGLMYATFLDDLGSFLVSIATGQATHSPLPTGDYLACMQLKSEEAIESYLQLKGGDHTKFMHYMMDGDKKFAVPGVSLLGICSSKGESFSECQRGIEEESKQLNIFYLDKDEKFIPVIKEKYITPISELGVSFGPESQSSETPKPEKSESRKALLDPWGIPNGDS